MLRLYSLGYLDTMYLSMRPYTRRSALHMLQASEDAILAGDDEQAQEILSALLNELTDEGITSTKMRTTRNGVRGAVGVHADDGGFGADPAGQLPSGADVLQRLRTAARDGLQQHHRLLDAERAGAVLAVCARRVPACAERGGLLAGAVARSSRCIDEIPFAPPNDPQATIPGGADCGAESVPAGGGDAVVPHSGTRDLRRKVGRVAGAGDGRRDGLVEQRGEHLLVPHQPGRADQHQVSVAAAWAGALRLLLREPEGAHRSRTTTRSTRRCSRFQPTANFQFGFQRTIDLRRRGPRAGHAAHVSEGILRHQRHERRREVFAGRSGGALLGVQLLLPAAVRAQLPDAVCGLGDA